jgi:glycosyltransferase involved in cell wall biosynthesis
MDTPAALMDASVVVCTYNRCESLADTLAAVAGLQVPGGFEWELIVVDNNSRDATRQTVESFGASHPGLRVSYLFEQKQGLSHARNLGIAAAQGEFIVFTDDDVLPAADWLSTLVGGMREHGCAAAGGYIEPLWLAPPPPWLTARFYGFLALRTDRGEPRQARCAEEMPFGASLAFARSVFARIGVFDPQLGRKGNVLAGGEEIDVLMRVVDLGERVMYFPQARVRHKVEAFRLTKRYFRRWRYQCSMNEAATMPTAGRRIAGVPLYLLPQLARAGWKSLTMRITHPADEAFRQEMIVWHFLGLVSGLHRRR